MSATQVTAAIALLRKVLPDLSATELTGEHSGTVVHEVRWLGPMPGRTVEPRAEPGRIEHLDDDPERSLQ